MTRRYRRRHRARFLSPYGVNLILWTVFGLAIAATVALRIAP